MSLRQIAGRVDPGMRGAPWRGASVAGTAASFGGFVQLGQHLLAFGDAIFGVAGGLIGFGFVDAGFQTLCQVRVGRGNGSQLVIDLLQVRGAEVFSGESRGGAEQGGGEEQASECGALHGQISLIDEARGKPSIGPRQRRCVKNGLAGRARGSIFL